MLTEIFVILTLSWFFSKNQIVINSIPFQSRHNLYKKMKILWHITWYRSKQMYFDMLQLYHNIPNNTLKFVVPEGTTFTGIWCCNWKWNGSI